MLVEEVSQCLTLAPAFAQQAEGEQDYHRQHEDCAQDGTDKYRIAVALRKRDIHHSVLCRNALERELIESRELAEQAELKQSFLNNMSHEIRTPLNAIVGFSDMLANEPEFSNEERQEFVDIINTNTKLLLKLVGDILELSRIESGNLSFTFQHESVRKLLDDVYQTHSLLIHPPLQFVKDFPVWDVQVDVDSMRLTQVLTNFLNNANKFTAVRPVRARYISMWKTPA